MKFVYIVRQIGFPETRLAALVTNNYALAKVLSLSLFILIIYLGNKIQAYWQHEKIKFNLAFYRPVKLQHSNCQKCQIPLIQTYRWLIITTIDGRKTKTIITTH